MTLNIGNTGGIKAIVSIKLTEYRKSLIVLKEYL